MYGADRLTDPLLRVNAAGEFDKNGKFKPVTWDRAFDEMAKQFKSDRLLEEHEWRRIGIAQSRGWAHCGFHQ